MKIESRMNESHRYMDLFPYLRLRRLRRSGSIRDILQETRVDVNSLVCPVFVKEGIERPEPIDSLPGYNRLPLHMVVDEVESLVESGIRAILLFGIPEEKDEYATSAYADDGVVQRAVKSIRSNFGEDDLVIITDVCTCQYTTHGHCGMIKDDDVDNDSTLNVLSRIAVSHARAGADIVAPSSMMDGQVKTIRDALDGEGFDDTLIMSYSAKYYSTLYSPFRMAADSAPKLGERRGYQLNPANLREALREMEQDILEGADIIMVKPAIAYLDVIRLARERFTYPLAAYSVSGEYAMVRSAGIQGFINEDSLIVELLTCIKRAGADMIITYFAKRAAELLNNRE